MARYYLNLNPQLTGEREVHKDGCSWLTQVKNPEYLGAFLSCQSAVAEARRKHPSYTIDGCAHCIPDCHTR